MQLTKRQNFSKKITKNIDYNFEIAERGLCYISITAICHSSKQTGERGGEDLRVEINGQSFREIPPEKNIQLYNIPASWNGSKLKGLKKIVVFILWLEKGNHKITFIPHESAKLENLEIKELGQNVKNTIFDISKKAEDGDRRPWYTFALINLPLKYLSMEATVQKRFQDSDDVKIIIDGKIKRNIKGGRHKFWYFVGGILPWIIWRIVGRNKKIKVEFNESLASGIHYIEVHADRMPVLHNVELDFGEEIEVKRIPTVDDPKWTGKFEDDPEEILLARLIFGEARNQPQKARIWVAGTVLNRVAAGAWDDTIKEVILKSGQFDPLKEKDPNYKNIIDPLKDKKEADKIAWEECYKIAVDIISGQLKNPTEATHFHGKGITKEWFMENVVPNGRFLKKFGDSYFYWSLN